MLVNDDLGAFAVAPVEMARGSVTTVRKNFVGLLEANSGNGQTMRDGTPLFDATRGNVASSGASLSVTSLSLARNAMRRQTGLQGEVIDVRPWAVAVPPELETQAQQLVGQISPDATENVNPFAGNLEIIVEAGLADPARWYVCANPALTEGLAHSYLEGNGPQVMQREGWNVEGMEFKVRMDFGAAFVDTVGWYMNPGQ